MLGVSRHLFAYISKCKQNNTQKTLITVSYRATRYTLFMMAPPQTDSSKQGELLKLKL